MESFRLIKFKVFENLMSFYSYALLTKMKKSQKSLLLPKWFYMRLIEILMLMIFFTKNIKFLFGFTSL